MSDLDDHVIPYQEAVRRHRAREEQRRRKAAVPELRISDAMEHLLEEATVKDAEGQTPAHLREIVERDFPTS